MKLNKFFLFVAIFIAANSVNAQTDAPFFWGEVFTKNASGATRHPYLIVLLADDSNPDAIIAATLTDPVGEMAFPWAKVDWENRIYRMTVLLPDGQQLAFVSDKSKHRPAATEKFSGCMYAPIALGVEIEEGYYTEEEINIDTKSEMPVLDQIAQKCGLIRDGSTFFTDDDRSVKLFLNRSGSLTPTVFNQAMAYIGSGNIPIGRIVFIKLSKPNDYFFGAISLEIPAMGEMNPPTDIDLGRVLDAEKK